MWIQHHGIKNQKWGIRNGPPYPLKGGSYRHEEKKTYERKRGENVISNKKHFDVEISKDQTLKTLSFDKDRTKNTDMFYATFDKFDSAQYQALFNKKIPKEGGYSYKYEINSKLKDTMNVASEDSSVEVFKKLYEKDRDFYNFVTDQSRMQSYFVKDKYKFRGYRESKKSLDKEDKSESDINKIYRMFNYVIPYDVGEGGKDVRTQRTKFFKEMKKEGYGAVLDTNDAIYGGFKAKAPIIVFDMDLIVPDKVRDTSILDVKKGEAMLIYRKLFNK